MPGAMQILGEMGAVVIKVEPPAGGSIRPPGGRPRFCRRASVSTREVCSASLVERGLDGCDQLLGRTYSGSVVKTSCSA